ncbi:MAG: hypothetical protein DRI73_04205 [Bacteroidetes bacterium]|nr:MAG: hypothetical protein DRI73_04205 [Bacteroidota bacterium]
MWNSIIAGVVFEHDKMETLRLELGRNASLLELKILNIYQETEGMIVIVLSVRSGMIIILHQ